MKKKLSFMVALILMVNGIGATTGVKAYDSTVNEVENVLEEKDTNGNNQETKDIKDENSSLEDTEVVKETSNLGNNTNEEIIARALSEKTYKVMDNFLVNGSCVILTENIICDNLEMDGGSTTYLDLNGYELIVMGNVEQRSGCIDINNGILNIYGDYNLSGSLGMFRENDYLVVGGDLLIEGNNLNCFRFGILELKGNLMVTGIIDQSENFKLVFSGKKEQVVDVAGGGCFSNFNYIDTSKSAGVRFQTPIRLRDLSGLENVVGTLILEVSLITLNSDVTLNCEIKFQDNTTVYLNGYTFNINNNLKVDDCTNYIYLQGGTLNVNNIEINGLNIYIDGGGTLSAKNIKQNDGKMNIEDGWLNIAENYIITEDGLLYSTNEDNHILVGGDFIVENLTLSKSNDSFKGILEIKGNLSAIQIYLSGKSQVVFSGEKEQIVKIQYPEESRFLYIDTTKSAGVKFETPVNIGYLSRLDNVVGKLTLTGVCFLSQDLTPNFELAFTENISLSFINECTLNLGNRDLELKGGTISINGGVLNVNNLNQSGGSMNVTNGTLNVAGNYNLTDSGALKMVCEKDYVFVAGDLLINSDNLLDFNTFTNGTLVLKGNLTQKKGEIDRSNRNFLQEKKFKLVFTGEKEQIVNIETPEDSKFNYIDTSKSAGVIFKLGKVNNFESFNKVVGDLKLASTTIDLTKDLYIPYALELQSEATLNLNGFDLYVLQDVKINGGEVNFDKGGRIIVKGTPIKEDVNNDGVIDILDLTTIAEKYNLKKSDEGFNNFMDFNNDEKIDIFDLVTVAKGIN